MNFEKIFNDYCLLEDFLEIINDENYIDFSYKIIQLDLFEPIFLNSFFIKIIQIIII